ncbi:hypothetical protein DM01DRAFT_1094052, partial [Hesseltinella vesiculosa]
FLNRIRYLLNVKRSFLNCQRVCLREKKVCFGELKSGDDKFIVLFLFFLHSFYFFVERMTMI